VQNSISRETVNGTRLSFFCTRFTRVPGLSALPQFVKIGRFGDADLACSKIVVVGSVPDQSFSRKTA
jgi:hypothetical protein